MFCTTLRQRPVLNAIVPALISSTTLNVKESRLTSYDLVLPLSPTTDLYILLLSSQDLLPEKQPGTSQRLAHFTSLTTASNLLLILVQPTLQSLAALQILLLDPSLQSPAILLSPSPAGVPYTISAYRSALLKPLLPSNRSLSPKETLRLATDGHLSDLSLSLVGDIFHSLAELGRGCTAFLTGRGMEGDLKGKMETVAALLPRGESEGLLRFWGE